MSTQVGNVRLDVTLRHAGGIRVRTRNRATVIDIGSRHCRTVQVRVVEEHFRATPFCIVMARGTLDELGILPAIIPALLIARAELCFTIHQRFIPGRDEHY